MNTFNNKNRAKQKLSSSITIANNTYCAGKLFLPSVSLIDNTTYVAWLKYENNYFTLDKLTLLHPSMPHYTDSEYQDPLLRISNVLASDSQQTIHYNAILPLLENSNPMQFSFQNSALEIKSSANNALYHACISSCNKPQAVLIDGYYHIRYELFLQDIDLQKYTVSKVFDVKNPDNSDGIPFIFEQFNVLAANSSELELRELELPAN